MQLNKRSLNSSFNTVNGKYTPLSPLFYLHFVQVREVRTSSSLCSSAVSHSAAHTVNGKDCCNVVKGKGMNFDGD